MLIVSDIMDDNVQLARYISSKGCYLAYALNQVQRTCIRIIYVISPCVRKDEGMYQIQNVHTWSKEQ